MAELRVMATEVGFVSPRTYIQSGNLVFEARGAAGAVQTKLEAALLKRFGFPVESVVRTAATWASVAAENPFSRASAAEPHRVMLLLSKAPPNAGAAAELVARARAGEEVVATAGGLWGYYPQGVGASKLTPALFDRLVGSKVTARNWRTVLQLQAMAQPSS